MSDDERPLVMPLFPLPNVVALPGVALHLHVFESRYREMIGDLDQENPFLALALVEQGFAESREPNPPISDIVCAGRVTHLQPMDDGRFFLIFASMGRAHLIGEDQDSHPYRVARIEWLEPPGGIGADDLGLKLEVYRAFQRYAATKGDLAEKLGQLRDLDLPLGRLVDMLASCMPLDIELQRRLLVELDPNGRALLLLTILATVNGRSDRFSVH